MCLAVPGKIVSIDGSYADVDIMGVIDRVNIQLIQKPIVGEYVLIHTGFAIQRIDDNHFNFLNKTFREILNEDDMDG